MTRLGVNIDHVATIREARKIDYPDPVQAAALVELTGAHGITVHLRQDRRHIDERDIDILKRTIKTHLNVEISVNPEMIDLMKSVQPDACCLVPERVEEVTTEGGLDILKFADPTRKAVEQLKSKGIRVAVFIEPEEKLIRKAVECAVDAIEINTAKYSEASTPVEKEKELTRIQKAATVAHSSGIEVHAGHGLNWHNIQPVARIPEIAELNIGHSIIGRAIFVGLDRAINELLTLISEVDA
jgi:pyridoxine 5-phosphate synthase